MTERVKTIGRHKTMIQTVLLKPISKVQYIHYYVRSLGLGITSVPQKDSISNVLCGAGCLQ